MRTVFQGKYGLSLGGFPCIRGYATLRDIARVSAADPAYQRELTDEHVEEIKRYFAAGEYLFFPEIILSTTLVVDYEKPGAPTDDPLAAVRQGHKFKSNVNGLRIYPRASRCDISVADGDRPFKRIDGNHRLSALEALDDDKYDRFLAPFCIILFSPADAARNEKALFHNINSKARTLTSEESLRGIIDDEKGFPDSVLSEQFGAEYLQCRRLDEKLDFDYLNNLRVVFGKMEGAQECHRSLLIQSLQDVKAQFDRLDLGTMPGIAAVFDAIKAVNDIYADPRLQRSHAQGLFAAFLFWQLHPRASEGQRQQFANWVLRTHQYELRSINTADLIKIFEKIAQARRRQIFISMWFDPSTKANYEAIEAAVADLNAAHQLDIKLRPIRVDQFDTGYSYEINQEVLDLIESSGLMIADLSGGNRNVHHEIGYLMGLNKGHGLPDENFLLVHNEALGPPAKDTRGQANALHRAARSHTLANQSGTNILVDHYTDIRAQQVVGVIAAPGCSLEILPKIDATSDESDETIRTRLISMLDVALGLKLGDGQALAMARQKETLLDILIVLFADRLLAETRRGLPRAYVAREKDLAALRGRLDVIRQFTHHAIRPDRLACRFDTLVPDTPLLRIMKACVVLLRRHARTVETQRRLDELRFILAGVSDVPFDTLPWAAVRIDRTNRRWESLFELAKLFLKREWQRTDHDAKAGQGITLLFAMHDLFEAYIAALAKRALRNFGLTVIAQGGFVDCLKDERHGGTLFRTKPDILVKRGPDTVMVIDTKWKLIGRNPEDRKRGVSQSDVYQMMAYARLYRCREVMLLYPHHGGLGSSALDDGYAIMEGNERLRIASVDLVPDKGAVQQQLAGLIAPVVQAWG